MPTDVYLRMRTETPDISTSAATTTTRANNINNTLRITTFTSRKQRVRVVNNINTYNNKM